MDDTTAFIVDKTFFNFLFSKEHEDLCKAQLFLDYLSWRNYNRKAYLTPSTHKLIDKEVQETNDKKIIALFENWFEDGSELIGEDTTTDEEDIISLNETLETFHGNCFVISEDLDIEHIEVINMEKLDTYLKDKPDFYKHIFEVYYDTSSI